MAGDRPARRATTTTPRDILVNILDPSRHCVARSGNGSRLLIRGQAELDAVDHIPDEYLRMNGSYTMTPEQRTEWEAGVRSYVDGMVRIVVAPT
jgi:hypothetical protein